MTAVEQFIVQATQLALKLGIKRLVIAVRDPQTREARVVASPGAMEDLTPIVAEKFHLGEAPVDTEWTG
jgi:hypothetical protein